MDPIYPRFATADPLFYDEPRRHTSTTDRYDIADEVDWTTWHHTDDGHWVYWRAAASTIPDQGWKIHVSTVPEGARAILRKVSRYCHHHSMSFKHLSHPTVLFAVDSKEGDRSGSGKFITIYPADESVLHDALVDLDSLIGGEPGPYVLSDLRWNAGPLSVRYGAFTREFADVDGVRVAALRTPDGELVEDVRSSAFLTPEWVTLPPFLHTQLASLGGVEPPPKFPRVTRALHHSNGGGVYEAVDHNGEVVVLKEARPHAGLTPDGRDAVTRVRDEARVLAAIDSPAVVRTRRLFTAFDHQYLVMERVEGINLSTAVASRHPFVRTDTDLEHRRRYRDWARTVGDRVAAALRAVHDAGFSHGDFHPGNVLVLDDDSVVLLDFEMARPLSENAAAIIGAPGFVPSDRRGGAALDRYALACIRLFLFAPLTPLLGLDAHKAGDLVTWVQQGFDLGDAWGAQLLNDLGSPALSDEVPQWVDRVVTDWLAGDSRAVRAAIDAVANSLLADASSDRADRAWPGDPAQFGEPASALAHGASGVMVALHAARAAPSPEVWSWWQRSVESELRSPAPRLGLYDGLAGLAWAQRELGLEAEAARTIARIRGSNLSALGPDLYGGLAGVGLTLLAESEHDATLLPLVLDIAARIDQQFSGRSPRDRATVATGRGGLLRGATGIALFASRLFAITEDGLHLDLAERALDDDLAVCTWAPDGSLQVDEGWRTMPYLGSGSAGIGLVIAEMLPFTRHGDRYEQALAAIRRAASTEFVVQSGLFQGRAGLIHFLLALERSGFATAETGAALAEHVRLLSLHAIRRPNGVGFPGQALMRLSCDLATGSAGVLTALCAYQGRLDCSQLSGHAVPFLGSPSTTRPPLVAVDPAQIARR